MKFLINKIIKIISTEKNNQDKKQKKNINIKNPVSKKKIITYEFCIYIGIYKYFIDDILYNDEEENELFREYNLIEDY